MNRGALGSGLSAFVIMLVSTTSCGISCQSERSRTTEVFSLANGVRFGDRTYPSCRAFCEEVWNTEISACKAYDSQGNAYVECEGDFVVCGQGKSVEVGIPAE